MGLENLHPLDDLVIPHKHSTVVIVQCSRRRTLVTCEEKKGTKLRIGN